jgi:Fibronectin type III domain
MSTKNYRVALDFAKLPDTQLDEFTSNVVACLTGNANFPAPSISLANLTAAQTAFENALTAAAQGGVQLTAVKNEMRSELLLLLRKEAAYVQGIASQNVAMLLSSGFNAVSTNRTRTQLDVPGIASITNEMSAQLVVSSQPVANARAYEAQVKNGTGGFAPAGTFTQARRIVLTGLTPGQTYTVQIRAVGGSTGYSDWSDPVSHMAM